MLPILQEIYFRMYLIRSSELKICELYHEDEMKTPMHMSMGQEAAPAAISLALGVKSKIISTYRSHAPFLAHTKQVNKFFCELFGKDNGTAAGRSGSMHLADIENNYICSTAIVAAGLPLGLGVAFSEKYNLTGNFCIVYFGDGAIEEGSFWETLNAASLMQLPLLFVCEDNDYAVHTKKNERRGFSSIKSIVESFECDYIFDESNDAEEIYNKCLMAKKSLENSRPVFFHIKCIRYLEHVGIKNDFEAYYRNCSDKDIHVNYDALQLIRNKLINASSLTETIKIEDEIDRKINAAVNLAKLSSFPQKNELLTGVYFD